MRKIRNIAAEADAAIVLTPIGKFCVDSMELSAVMTPVLAAVSPNRESGPWMSAGATPL